MFPLYSICLCSMSDMTFGYIEFKSACYHKFFMDVMKGNIHDRNQIDGKNIKCQGDVPFSVIQCHVCEVGCSIGGNCSSTLDYFR